MAIVIGLTCFWMEMVLTLKGSMLRFRKIGAGGQIGGGGSAGRWVAFFGWRASTGPFEGVKLPKKAVT